MIERQTRQGDDRREGRSALRAIVRWAWRLFRREWRQQGLVLGLLTVGVAAAIVSATIAYNVAPAEGKAEFGTASHFLQFDGSDIATMRADVDSAAEWFDVIQVITNRRVTVPGQFDTLEIRGQDPDGPYGGPMLALRDGHYPRGEDEVAVTDGIAGTFALDIGDRFSIDGSERTVVGAVENPNDLRQEFVLVNPDHEEQPDLVTVLVQASDDRVFDFRSPSMSVRSSRGAQEHLDTLAALSMLGTASMGMVFVALITTASFVVLAQRRLRQLGMLAAIGASERHLRLVMLSNGIILGVVAALIGSTLALATWIVFVPFLEEPFGHRIDPLDVPWWLVGAVIVLGIVTATTAAWWPARVVARVSITRALSGRPPVARTSRRSAAIAIALTVTGVACLLGAQYVSAVLVIIGTLATVAGVLLLCPVVIRAAALPAGRLPVAMRIALRDMSRYQVRAGAALAAVSLALWMATSIAITASAAELDAGEGNLSDRQLIVRIGDPEAPVLPPDFSPFIPVLTSTELQEREAGVDRISSLLDAARVIPLDVAYDPELGLDERFDAQSGVTLAEFVSDGPRPGYRDLTLLYVATPEMLEFYGIDAASLDADAEILTSEQGDLWITGLSGEPGVQPPRIENAERLPTQFSSLPGSFITEAALRERGWDKMRAGWLIESSAPLTGSQIAGARGIAAEAGLTIEFRDQQEGLAALRTRATVIGMIVAIGVIAMTVGLIRSEAGRDLRTLTATGATGMTRRVVIATTAGALALFGVTIGIVGAYLIMAAGYVDASSILGSVPLVHLIFSILGVPTAAVLLGWLMAGGEPPALTRQPIE